MGLPHSEPKFSQVLLMKSYEIPPKTVPWCPMFIHVTHVPPVQRRSSTRPKMPRTSEKKWDSQIQIIMEKTTSEDAVRWTKIIYPLVENGPVEIVDLPSYKIVIFQLPEGRCGWSLDFIFKIVQYLWLLSWGLSPGPWKVRKKKNNTPLKKGGFNWHTSWPCQNRRISESTIPRFWFTVLISCYHIHGSSLLDLR